MVKMTISEQQAAIFGSLFLLANKLQVVGDRYLAAEEMTTKQWFLTAVISRFAEDAPTLSEVAEVMNTSRQNVKQLALKLVEKGFLSIDPDPWDARAIRLRVTEKCKTFWSERQDKDTQFLEDLFRDLSELEVDVVARCLGKIIANIEKMPTG